MARLHVRGRTILDFLNLLFKLDWSNDSADIRHLCRPNHTYYIFGFTRQMEGVGYFFDTQSNPIYPPKVGLSGGKSTPLPPRNGVKMRHPTHPRLRVNTSGGPATALPYAICYILYIIIFFRFIRSTHLNK